MDEVVRLASALAGRPVLEGKDVGRQFMTEEGRRFAYRERAHTPGNPVRPVELVKEGPPRSQKVKVRWLDGEYEGLEEWVPKVRLVVSCEEKEALLDDERRMFVALEASGDVYGTATYRAVETVFFAIPQELGAEVWFGMKAIERELLSIDDLDAAAARLGLDVEALLSEPHSYVDRFGEYKAPFGMAVKVAKHCCERFSRGVLRHLQAEEEKLRQELVSGNLEVSRSWWTDNEAYRKRAEARLEELGPIFALVREWCGQDATEEFREVIALRQEVDRLQGVVKDLARWLKNAGHPQKAALVLKELGRTDEGG